MALASGESVASCTGVVVCRRLSGAMVIVRGGSGGQLHRGNDLPAVEHADGSRDWYKRGQLVRWEY